MLTARRLPAWLKIASSSNSWAGDQLIPIRLGVASGRVVAFDLEPARTTTDTPQRSLDSSASEVAEFLPLRRPAMAILWWIIVGLIAGWATGKIMGGAGYGFIMDIVVGIIGALIGGFIMSRLGMAASGGMIYTIIVAIFGAIILTLIVRLITGRGRGAA